MESLTIGFIGGGNMAYAIAKGLVRSAMVTPEQIITSAKTEARLNTVWKDLGTKTTLNNVEVFDSANIIFLCVKPHLLPAVLEECCSKSSPRPESLFVSVAAGVTIDHMEKILCREYKCKIVRTMPNTPCLVSSGVVIFACNEYCTLEDKTLIKTLLQSSALVEEVDEGQIDAMSSIMGCSIAWFQMVIEAMSDGAVNNGVPRAISYKLISKSMEGAARMILETGQAPGVLKDQVTSPHGSTIRGLYELEQGGIRGIFMKAVNAATQRNRELGNQK